MLGNLTEALNFYKKRGYAYKGVPWYVGREAYYATKPDDATADVQIQPYDKYLVASGEQSFLQLMLDGTHIGKSVCVTPCFRSEQVDTLHQPYFMKVELIQTTHVSEGGLMKMIHDACSFFEQFVPVTIAKTGLVSYDIVDTYAGIELGSYGIREYAHLKWIYGTGCAEPRLTQVRERNAESCFISRVTNVVVV